METPQVQVPGWVQESVFYEIFVDRFDNGSQKNDPDNILPWAAAPTLFDRMGGDLAGIRKHLDYLQELGVHALYLTPVFQAGSYHGYDTIDYYKIDPRFGTNAEFKKLTSEAHERGIHIVLDGVFNHTHSDFFAFQDVLQNGEKSKYKDWFQIKYFPVSMEKEGDSFEHWGGVATMPLLNQTNPEVHKYFCEVAVYWMKEAGVDGWRLDAAEHIDHSFLKAFRTAVREANPEAYIVGEVWPEAQEYLRGDECDAVMNYAWRGNVFTFFMEDTLGPTDFDRQLHHLREIYPPEVTYAQLNMLGSHDCLRLHNHCQGNILKVGQCVLLQMTYPGVPMIYYGDEIGIQGADDPDNRRAMVWNPEQWDIGLLDFHKKLIQLRNEKKVLRYGDFQTVMLHEENRLFGFKREFEGETILVLFNSSDAPQCAEVPLECIGSEPFFDWLGTSVALGYDEQRAFIELPPRGMALLGRGS